MAIRLAITLNDEQEAQLEALAEARNESTAELAAEAVAQYLADDAIFRAAVDEGLAAGRAGDDSDFGAFASDLRRRMAIRVAESDR